MRLEELPKSIQMAPQVKQMHAQGMSILQIAFELGWAWETVTAALEYAKTGRLPSRKTTSPAKKRKKRPSDDPAPVPKYKRLAAEVARLHDTENVPLIRIAQQLGIGRGTATQAYRYYHRSQATSPPAV